MSANSASCERLFSVFGNTLTKLRNKLGDKVLVDLTEVKMHVRDEHISSAKAKQRLKRRFQPPGAPPVPAPQTPDLGPGTGTVETVGLTPQELAQHELDRIVDGELPLACSWNIILLISRSHFSDI